MTRSQAWRWPQSKISPAELRTEGVVELGRPVGTSVLYVQTPGRLCLFHAGSLVDRVLDAYAVELAVSWLESGFTSAAVAGNLGVHETTLRGALLAAGYERLQTPGPGVLSGARRPGNRRGRLVLRAAAPPSAG